MLEAARPMRVAITPVAASVNVPDASQPSTPVLLAYCTPLRPNARKMSPTRIASTMALVLACGVTATATPPTVTVRLPVQPVSTLAMPMTFSGAAIYQPA